MATSMSASVEGDVEAIVNIPESGVLTVVVEVPGEVTEIPTLGVLGVVAGSAKGMSLQGKKVIPLSSGTWGVGVLSVRLEIVVRFLSRLVFRGTVPV